MRDGGHGREIATPYEGRALADERCQLTVRTHADAMLSGRGDRARLEGGAGTAARLGPEHYASRHTWTSPRTEVLR